METGRYLVWLSWQSSMLAFVCQLLFLTYFRAYSSERMYVECYRFLLFSPSFIKLFTHSYTHPLVDPTQYVKNEPAIVWLTCYQLSLILLVNAASRYLKYYTRVSKRFWWKLIENLYNSLLLSSLLVFSFTKKWKLKSRKWTDFKIFSA